jgi:hypothetical protein
MSSLSIIAKIEKQLKALKLSTEKSKKPSKSKKVTKRKITECTKKSQLKKFTVVELKDFIAKHKISTKKVDKMHKEDWMNLIWKHLKKEQEESSDSSSSSGDSDSSSDLGSIDESESESESE